jgi:hypothetical protein
MEHFNWRCFFMALLIALAGLGMIGGCDSGEKALDEVTGNRAVKQYHESKKDVEKIADQQAERYKNIPDDDDKEDEER